MTDRYVRESFTPEERDRLRGHVSSLEGPVFALTALPEVVKGALFARYSRSPKSLRRLLLDEFAGDLPTAQDRDGGRGGRAEQLYERVFVEYGDDSVAQLGGAHVAVEQASNLLTKVLEWGRLASYLEQSTRYIPYDDAPGGRYRYYRPPEIMASRHATAFESTLDAVFDRYAELMPRMRAWAEERFPRDDGTPPGAYRRAITAKTCDVLRGMLPAATVSNVGIFASGQAYESLLLRLRSSGLEEAREVGDLMLAELRKVIPAFLVRVDQPHRGGAWADYLARTRSATRAVADDLLADIEATGPAGPSHGDLDDEVTLTWFDPGAEVDLVTGMLYPHSHLSEEHLRRVVAGMAVGDRQRVVDAYTGERGNRRHKPGRALERVGYRFDICSDYGAFRDLQRHRMLTIEWQDLSCRHGYDVPAAIAEAGVSGPWHEAMERQAELWAQLLPDVPRAAQYAVGFAWKLRYSMQLNARAAMQMLELRTGPQGHESYRRVCQRMHTLIAEQAGHRVVADMMRFVDHSWAGRGGGPGGGKGDGELERLEAERALESRRAARTG